MPSWGPVWIMWTWVCVNIILVWYSICSSHSWWRHQTEAFSVLLALCAGNSRSPVNSPHKGQWRWALLFSLICVWINGWVNNREARGHRANDDVIVMDYINWTHHINVKLLELVVYKPMIQPLATGYPRAPQTLFNSRIAIAVTHEWRLLGHHIQVHEDMMNLMFSLKNAFVSTNALIYLLWNHPVVIFLYRNMLRGSK